MPSIEEVLQRAEVRHFDVPTLDQCMFQSIMFRKLFMKLEQGKWRASDPQAAAGAAYFMRHSLRALKSLEPRLRAVLARFDADATQLRLSGIPQDSGVIQRAALFARKLSTHFEAIEAEFLELAAHPDRWATCRDRACLSVFVLSLLGNACHSLDRWLDAALAEDAADIDWAADDAPHVLDGFQSTLNARGLAEEFLLGNTTIDSLYSPDPLSAAEMAFYLRMLDPYFDPSVESSSQPDQVRRMLIPSFSKNGDQGVLALLDAQVHGAFLVTLACEEELAGLVHNGEYEGQKFLTVLHDIAHAHDVLIADAHYAVKIFRYPYEDLVSPESDFPPQEVMRSAAILLDLLHERPSAFESEDAEDDNEAVGGAEPRTFLSDAKGFYTTAFEVSDMAILLGKAGFDDIPELLLPDSEKLNPACAGKVCEHLDTCWEDFKKRHAVALANGGCFDLLPEGYH